MAKKYVSLIEEGYGQIELNHVAFRRDGRIEAQCAIDENFEPHSSDLGYDFGGLENGTIVGVNTSIHKVVPAWLTLQGNPINFGLPYGVHYSAERTPDKKASGLKNFILKPDGPLPRIGYLAEGDTFTTNNVVFEAPDEVSEEHYESYFQSGVKSRIGYGQYYAIIEEAQVRLSLVSFDSLHQSPGDFANYPRGPLFKVAKLTTMPDGQRAVELHVLRAR